MAIACHCRPPTQFLQVTKVSPVSARSQPVHMHEPMATNWSTTSTTALSQSLQGLSDPVPWAKCHWGWCQWMWSIMNCQVLRIMGLDPSTGSIFFGQALQHCFYDHVVLSYTLLRPRKKSCNSALRHSKTVAVSDYQRSYFSQHSTETLEEHWLRTAFIASRIPHPG